MGMRGKRLGSWGGGRRGGRGPAGGGAGGARAGAGPAPPAGGWADLPRDLLEAVARAVPLGDRLCFRLVCRRWAAAGKAVAPGAEEEQLPPGKVTRTLFLDMAASVARTKMMLNVLQGSPILIEKFEKFRHCVSSDSIFESKEAPLIGFMGCLCAFSAGWGTPKILKWARASGFPWDEDTCAFAFKNGHLEDLQ